VHRREVYDKIKSAEAPPKESEASKND
jgi:hypothetical protein